MNFIKWSDYRNKILSDLDNEAFFLSLLENTQRRGSEWKATCPYKELHANKQDNTPSLTVNVTRGVYICQTCRSRGNAHTLYRYINKLSPEEAWFHLGDSLNIERPAGSKPARPDIDINLVSKYHQALMALTGPIRGVLVERRGYTDATLRRFQLGWDEDRITIPIYDEFNMLVNFRRYKWNSDDDQWKLLNYQDELGNTYGEVRIFGIENLVNDEITEIIWCEGETDRMLAEQYGFPAACPTSGAGSWKPEWIKYFRGKKRVYIMQDNDEAGRVATAKLSERLGKVTEVYTVVWPENFPDKGDITDFFTKCRFTAEDFKQLLANCVKYVDPMKLLANDTEEAKSVHLANSASAALYGKRIEVPVMVSGKDGTPFVVPKTFSASCGDHADSEQKRCQQCSLCSFAGSHTFELKATDEDLIGLTRVPKTNQRSFISEITGMNNKCPYLVIDIKEWMNMEELRLIPQAETSFGFSKEHEYVVRSGYFMGENMKTNKRYRLSGYMYPDPQTQHATYLFDRAYPEKDMISDFEMSSDIYEQLKVFQVRPGQTVEQKMDEIHKDLERNVTFIWERRDVAIAVDLIYHTTLHFYFQGQFVKRGWGELLIIGDSGQAKSTLVENLMSHYKLGEKHSGESSRRTGLVYSIQQTNKRWFLVWGALPLNDGGLLCLDELSGISEDDLAVMSDVRSSGIAKSTGVITAETVSRTRVIYLSNPRNGKQLDTETYGVNAVLKLFGKTEDVRRLDLVVAVASGDVPEEFINKHMDDMPEVLHVYDSDLCNMRVMWAWSRRPEQISFTEDAVKAILNNATEMGRRYSSKIPIVEPADQRIKIARLAVATACCVFSTSDGENVVVQKEHVDYAVNFMHKVYSARGLAYNKFSALDKDNSDTSDNKLGELLDKFIALPLLDHNETLRILYQSPYFSRNSLEDSTGLAKDELRSLLKFMIANFLVEKYKGDYRRYPLGTKFFEYALAANLTAEEIRDRRKNYYTDKF